MKKTIKLTLTTLAIFFVLISVFSACRSTQNTEHTPDIYADMTFSTYHNATQESYILTSYKGTAESVVVPNEYNGIPVVAIGTGAFESCENLKSVTFSEGIRYIEENAFISCPALRDISIPASVTSIVSTMVQDCKALEFVSVNSENPIYCSNSGLLIEKASKKVILGTKMGSFNSDCDVAVIGQGAFANTDLGNLNLPNTVVEIQAYAFAGCNKLTVVELPESIEKIGDNAFASCKNLRMVNISKNTTMLGERLFYACEKLEKIIIPDGVTELKQEMFYGCSSLNQIVIGKDVSSIAYNAFWGCTGLQHVYYGGTPAGWTTVRIDSSNTSYFPTTVCYYSQIGSLDTLHTYWSYEHEWFYGETSYNDSAYHWGTPAIIGDAFYEYRDFVFELNADGGSYALKSAGWNFEEYDGAEYTRIAIPATYKGLPVTVIKQQAFSCGLSEILLPQTIQVIEDYAFYACNLQKIVIPASVVKIGSNVFGFSSTLEVIEVSENNPFYHSKGNCLIETATKTLIAGCKESKIPNDGSVTRIGEYAFYWCHGLGHYLEIPEGVTHIEKWAFGECYGLMKVSLPKTLTQIDEGAFQGCTKLLEIDNHSSLKVEDRWEHGEVGYYAKHIYDSNYSNEESVLKMGGFGTSHEMVFYRDVDTYVLLGCWWNDYDVIWLPTSCNGESYKIHEYAFYGSEMAHLVIRGNILEIGASAFSECKNLKTILIDRSTGKIANSAFQNCTSLEMVFYGGTYGEWCAAGYDGLNFYKTPNLYFYSETQPADTNHQYWHYVDGAATPWYQN